MLIKSEPPDSPLVFHLIVSFLATISHFMIMAGLDKAIETVHAPNSVPHILSGKCYKRAIRAHTLIVGALGVILTKKALNIDAEETNEEPAEEEWSAAVGNVDLNNKDDSLEDDMNESMDGTVWMVQHWNP